MPDRVAFTACVIERLTEKNFGQAKIAELTDRFNGLADGFEQAGHGTDMASTLASAKLFDDLSYQRAETLKRTQKQLEVQADIKSRIDLAKDVKAGTLSLLGGPNKSLGFRAAHALKTMIESVDARFKGVQSVSMRREFYSKKWWATMAASVEHYGNGALGKTKATPQMIHDLVDEMYHVDTGSAVAKEFAQSYMKVLKMIPADFNAAGGSIRSLENYGLQLRQNPLKVGKTDRAEWIADLAKHADMTRMRWPNGAPITREELPRALDVMYDTLRTDGGSKIDPSAAGGRGAAIGNMLDEHRFYHVASADGWRYLNNKYGDGNAWNAITSHVDAMAHRTALVQVFGPNPDLAIKNMRDQLMAYAKNLDAKSAGDARHVFDRVVEPMFENYTRKNTSSPTARLPAWITGISNIMTGAQLGSVPVLAIAGDAHTSATMRWFNGLPMMEGVGHYLGYLTKDHALLEAMNAQNGHVHTEAVSGMFGTERYYGVQTYGPEITKRITNGVMALSGLERHTQAGRSTPINELMGYFARNLDKPLDELPVRRMMERYGISDAEWDAIRKNIEPKEVSPGVRMLRYLDVLDGKMSNASDLGFRWFNMLEQEARNAVPGSTLEAQTFMRGNTKPDTLPGVLLHSFSMYKNFPITMMQQYGRLAMTATDITNRTAFLAALGVGMLGVGALGIQLRELAKGREPRNMMDPKFIGASFLAGGSLSLWGDFLFSGVNQIGQGPDQMIGGPMAGLATDLINAELGPAWTWIDAMDRGQAYRGHWKDRQVELLKRYTPGTSLWWARLVLEREVWDKLELMADPQAARKKFANRIANQRRDYGNQYYAPPGQGL